MVFTAIVEGAKSLVRPLLQPLFVPFLYWTLSSLGTIVNVWTNGDRNQDANDFLNPLQPKPYDFIIVGAGSAGCLLANRLSRSYSVLLIEAGGEPNPLQLIPGFSLFFPNFPELDWQHRTVPQRQGTLASVNGESSWSTGLGLGGTGTLNYMIHLRGHTRDFENWARITNDSSWSWNGVLPFFKSYEDYEAPGDNINHGYGGDLRIEAPDFPRTATDFVRGGVELGYPNVDLNAPFTEGFDIIRYPIRNGVRQAPYKAFLEPIRSRSTLTIMKFAQVNKVLFREGNIAYGVEYDRHGQTYVAHARREVILSAGTVGSAKLLLLSGIGPRAHLNDLNIPVISDLPVGENLQDHLGVYLAPFFIRTGRGFFLDRDLTVGEFIKWFTLGRGRLTNSGCEATGVFSSVYAKARGEPDWPDIQLFSYGFTNFGDGAENLARIFNLKYDETDKYIRNDIGKDTLYLVVSGARPLSRGYIRLGGNSPYDKPIIDPNYLGDSGGIDLSVLLEGVKRAVYLMENTTAVGKELQARFTTTRLPGCEHLTFRSDEYWTCFIRRWSVTLHHPVGTAAIGSVVDTELRVNGVRGLRVIDGSVQPVLVVTNTQASILMIAEKGADMIMKYWRGTDQNRGKGKGFSGKNNLFGSLFGGGDNKGNSILWGNTNKRDAILEGNGQKNLSRYEGIVVKSGVNANKRFKQVDVKVYEKSMKQRLEKSLQDLKLVSELAREEYNKQFREIERVQKGRGTTRRPSTTTARPTTNAAVRFGISTEYYYDDEDGYESGDLEENGVPRPPPPPQPPTTWKPQVKLTEGLPDRSRQTIRTTPRVTTTTTTKRPFITSTEYYEDDEGYLSEQYEDYEENNYVPGPSPPPPPPKAAKVPVVKQQNLKEEQLDNNWSNRLKGVNNPNSLDAIEQFY